MCDDVRQGFLDSRPVSSLWALSQTRRPFFDTAWGDSFRQRRNSVLQAIPERRHRRCWLRSQSVPPRTGSVADCRLSVAVCPCPRPREC